MTPVVVSQLNIYPIKSCGGISVSSSTVEKRGFRHDRRWMIVDRMNVFMTQRTHPRLSLVTVNLLKDGLSLSAPDMGLLLIPVEPSGQQSTKVRVWDDSVDAVPVGKGSREWFSTFLKTDCQLVFMPDNSVRHVDRKYSSNQDHVSFADAFPFLLISEGSLEDLNSRLPAPIPMNRFRPNIVVRGCEPFAEDRWTRIHIRQVTFHAAKPCARCVTTTVDQATGQTGKEPLRTLSLFRNRNGKVLFGQNLIHNGTGTISVGDPVRT